MAKKQPVTPAQQLAAHCPHCGAIPGEKCQDYRGKGKAFCMERGRPEITAKKNEKKAAKETARKFRDLGGESSLLTFLHGGLDELLAAEGEERVSAQEVAERKLQQHRNAVGDFRHAEDSARHGFIWITLHFMRLVAAGLIGTEAEAQLWEITLGTFGNSPTYVQDRYRTALCTCNEIILARELRFDPAKVNQWNSDGRHVVTTEAWPPPGYAPVMTREEFSDLFPIFLHSVRPTQAQPEHDDGGLFDRIMKTLSAN